MYVGSEPGKPIIKSPLTQENPDIVSIKVYG